MQKVNESIASAVEIQNSTLLAVIMDLEQFALKTDEQQTALAKLVEAFQQAEKVFNETDEQKDAAIRLSNDTKSSINEANENSTIAQKLIDEADEYVKKIDVLIENAENGVGTPLEEWVDSVEVPTTHNNGKKCHSKSAYMESASFEDGTNGIAFTHPCSNDNKYIEVSIRGKKGVKKWTDSIVEMTPKFEGICRTKNLNKANGWEKCTYKLYAD